MDEYNNNRDTTGRPTGGPKGFSNNTLAFHAVCAAALAKFALDLIRPGPVGFLQAAWFMGKLERGTELRTGSIGFPQTLNALTANNSNRNQPPSSLLAAILHDVLPNLEHNDFDSTYFPTWVKDGLREERVEEDGLREVLKAVFEENQRLGIELRLGSWVHTSRGTEGPSANKGGGVSAEKTVGKVLILIGDVEGGGLADRSALLGLPVGVEDGRKYL
jgi:hypothetical protein